MMKYLWIVLIAQVCFAQNVEGYWKTVDEDGNEKSIVKIYKTEEGILEGVIEEVLNPERKDFVCVKCKGDKKDKPLEGLKIIENMTPDEDEWTDGSITDPNNGKTYDCKLWLEDDDQNTLNVRGYVGFFYRTQQWIKVDKP